MSNHVEQDRMHFQRVIFTFILSVAFLLILITFSNIKPFIYSTIIACINIFVLNDFRIVKLTSPKLNYLIIAGTITMYMSVLFYLIPTTSPSIAQLSCLVSGKIIIINQYYTFICTFTCMLEHTHTHTHKHALY